MLGIEIVPIKDFADEMSTGVSYFEQFVWDLEQRGVSNIDIPVLVLGVMADKTIQPARASSASPGTMKVRGTTTVDTIY